MMKAFQLIVAFLLLVTIHEFGHYIFARIFGIRVNRFYLFFNPWFSLLKYYPSKGKLELISWTKKVRNPRDPKQIIREEEKALVTIKVGQHSDTNKKGNPSWAATMYGIGWLPLGGYCDIAGMVDETKSASDLASEPQPWEFRSKSAWKRFMVMVAGVLFNFLLAIVIYAGIAIHWGDRVVPFQEAYEGMDYMPALQEVGFKNGDVLLSINGKKADAKDRTMIWDMIQPGAKVEVLRNHTDHVTITIPDDLLGSIANVKETPVMYRTPVYIDKVQKGMPAVEAGLQENDRIIKVANDTTPSLTEFFATLECHKGEEVDILALREGKEVATKATLTDNGKLGIQLRPISSIYPIEEVKYNVLTALPRGWEIGTDQLATYVSSLKLVFTKEGAQQVGGFGAIGGLFPEKWDWYSFWQITAFLSVILAFMNIIPIPALDGGYVLFLLWEIITRRKPSDKFLEVANTIGFVFLFLLLIYANGNDILRALQ